MEINGDVVSQGIVLLSILTGFAFVIATELILRDSVSPQLQNVATYFFLTGLLCLAGVGFGILYFAQTESARIQKPYGEGFLLLLLFSAGIFILSLAELFRQRFTGEGRRDMYIITILVVIIVLIGITSVFIS